MAEATSWRELRSACAGKEIFEITPVILGGSPTDPANKMFLSRDEHIKAVRHWNRAIRELKRTTDTE